MQIGCFRKAAGKTLGNHYYIFSMVLFSFPFLPKDAAADHCHLEDIRLTGDLMPSLRPHFLQGTSTCHSSRGVPWLRPSVASSTKLVKSQVTHSWSGTPRFLGWQGWLALCRESAGGQFTQARRTPAMLMRLKSNRVEQKQSSHSQSLLMVLWQVVWVSVL